MEVLYEYLDGELTSERAGRVRAHLEACAHCFGLSRFEDRFLRFLEARALSRTAPARLRRQILRDLLLDEQ